MAALKNLQNGFIKTCMNHETNAIKLPIFTIPFSNIIFAPPWRQLDWKLRVVNNSFQKAPEVLSTAEEEIVRGFTSSGEIEVQLAVICQSSRPVKLYPFSWISRKVPHE